MSSIFLTGATGFVGGQILKELSQNHPSIAISALVRDPEAAKRISSLYTTVRTVVGSLDDAELVAEEASKATVVLNAASNKHVNGARAIYRGLSTRTTPSYWIQISGASVLAIKDILSPSYDVGRPSSDVYDDLDGADTIRSLIREHPVRELDNYLLDANPSAANVNTAIVFPPIIYGKGEGPGNQRSIQIPSLCKVTLERGHVVRAGEGLNRWGSVHVKDLTRLFTDLVLAALDGRQDGKLWNDDGIYLANAGEMSFAEISDRVSKAGLEKGYIQNPQVEVLSKSESDKTLPGGSIFFGSNARGNSRRAASLFGWSPREEGLEEEIPRALTEEAS